MNSMLLASDYTWLIVAAIALVAVIVIGIIMIRINRYYRINFNLNLIWGCAVMCLAVAAVAVGVVFLINGTLDSNAVCYGMIAVGIVLIIIRLIINIKKCGGSKGFLAFLVQLLFCVPGLIALFDRFKINSTNVAQRSYEDRYVANERRKRNNRDDY